MKETPSGLPVPAAILRAARRRSLSKGQVLFRTGDPAAMIFVVETGRVRLVRHGADGAEIAIHTARAGESFAEAAVFAAAYHCDAVALVPSRVLAIPTVPLRAAFATDAGAALAFAAALARQVQELRARLERQGIRSARQRLLRHLAARAEPGDRPLTELAAELGLSREALYRTVTALEKTGRIVRKGRALRLA